MTVEQINLGTSPTGGDGDTARQAFEKVNSNFTSLNGIQMALSAANFEANRARNKEMYAASGFVHLGKHESGKEVNLVKAGLYTSLTTPNKLLLGKSSGSGISKLDNAVLNVAGVLFYLPNEFEIKLPQAPDGTVTYDSATGAVVKHADSVAAFAAETATNKVVADRVDMLGFEGYLEEVTPDKPMVYHNGLIQSQATTMSGVGTVVDNTRPITYFAVFDGDESSRGRGVDFFAVSDADKKKLLADKNNNLYYLDDGRLVQWRLRQRTFAGAGNGDWWNTNCAESGPITNGILSFDTLTPSRVGTQGFKDAVYGDTGGTFYAPTVNVNNPIYNPHPERGCFTAYQGSEAAVTGVDKHSYFLVCGTVNRLNQGAYHPSLNSMGASPLTAGGTWSNQWYSSNVINGGHLNNQASCFNFSAGLNDGTVRLVDGNGYYGSIVGAQSGRPDNRYFDAIYAEGQGGVCRDMRYSAHGLQPVDFDEGDLRVKSGEYRGFEKLTRFDKNQYSLNGSQRFFFTNQTGYMNAYSYGLTGAVSTGFINVGFPIWAVKKDGSTIIVSSFNGGTNTAGFIRTDNLILIKGEWPSNNSSLLNEEWDMWCAAQLPTSVGGSFLQTDVIGDPAVILQTAALKDGWEGSWIPQIPDDSNTPIYFQLNRKALGSGNTSAVSTVDDGATWSTTSFTTDYVTNSVYLTQTPNRLVITTYQAFAYQTEPADNEVVYGGKSGVGDVWASISYNPTRGALFNESLTGNVPVATPIPNICSSVSLNTPLLDNKLNGTVKALHHPLDIAAPDNSGTSVKALDYNVNLNQQGFKCYAATELKHDGTDWGDDSKIAIVNGESTKTDLNGNTVKVVTHKLKEPIGWIKNKV